MSTHIQIGDITPRIQYTGDGSQTVFTYPFPIFADADMEVYEDTTLKTLTADYTVSGAGDSNGGDVTFITAPANQAVVTLRRQMAIKRTTDFQESGEFRAKVINDELDITAAGLQQVEIEAKRGLKLSATDLADTLTIPDKTSRASKFLGFDADGDAIASAGSADTVTVSSFMATVVDDADAPTARTTLGLGTAAVEDAAAGGSGDLLRADGDGSGLTGVGASAAEKANILLNSFRIAVNGGLSVQNMVDGIVDEFEDETGVDLPTSTNETYDAADDFYYGLAVETWVSGGTPSMPMGGTAANINDDNSGTSATTGAIGDLSSTVLNSRVVASIDLGSTKTVTKVDAVNISFGSSSNGGCIFVWSTNGTSWNTLGSSFTINTTPSSPQWTGSQSCRYIGMTVGQSNYTTDTLTIADLNGYENLPPNMTLVSNATTALATPADAFIALWQEDVDSVTLNTDLKAYASRDGGTTWDQITLTEEAALTTGRILAGSVTLTSSGTSMKYKIETLNNKEQRIHAVALQWS